MLLVWLSAVDRLAKAHLWNLDSICNNCKIIILYFGMNGIFIQMMLHDLDVEIVAIRRKKLQKELLGFESMRLTGGHTRGEEQSLLRTHPAISSWAW